MIVIILVRCVVFVVLVLCVVVSSQYHVCLSSSWCVVYMFEGDLDEQSASDQHKKSNQWLSICCVGIIGILSQ